MYTDEGWVVASHVLEKVCANRGEEKPTRETLSSQASITQRRPLLFQSEIEVVFLNAT